MKYRAWLVYDRAGAVRNKSYIQMHKEAGAAMQIEICLVVTEDIHNIAQYAIEQSPDFAIVRTIQPKLSRQLEELGIPVFNNSFVSEICNHKGKTFEVVRNKSDLPLVPSEYFPNSCLSFQFISRYPNHVIKAVKGHGGSQVFCTNEPWHRIRSGIDGSDFLIQPFIKGPGTDIRLYVIGSQIVGAVKRQAVNGFRANFSLGGQVCPFLWGKQETKWVKTLSDIFDFGLVGVDFLVDERGDLLLNEIEDVVGARMLYQCHPQIRLLEQYLSFILKKLESHTCKSTHFQ